VRRALWDLVRLWRWRADQPASHPAVTSRLEHTVRAETWTKAADELEEAIKGGGDDA
jgi:hypothetical protein